MMGNSYYEALLCDKVRHKAILLRVLEEDHYIIEKLNSEIKGIKLLIDYEEGVLSKEDSREGSIKE